jgi:hypothetical protein
VAALISLRDSRLNRFGGHHDFVLCAEAGSFESRFEHRVVWPTWMARRR